MKIFCNREAESFNANKSKLNIMNQLNERKKKKEEEEKEKKREEKKKKKRKATWPHNYNHSFIQLNWN